jgi:hypothetical protein
VVALVGDASAFSWMLLKAGTNFSLIELVADLDTHTLPLLLFLVEFFRFHSSALFFV